MIPDTSPTAAEDTTRTIWKFALPPLTDVFVLEMPADAKTLTVQMQNGEPCIWAIVNPSSPCTPREFRVVGTGHTMPANVHAYVGTFQMLGGALVFHLFEMTPPAWAGATS